ncbi:MAG: hypothetical protein QHC67_14605 [Sphingobium sp.]|uniref:hypothetical protein n=1 Tax=Sphingobium sp. TaxID=1912891 RepID=UPI0029A45FD9|nr:hypothetical protein [Sphingobium sp.]MDX3911032.1 hypothetical protein [Sphingobium sp.]
MTTAAAPAATFNPADPHCWTARGRPIEQAETLAAIWQAWPDLPPGASPDARMARLKARVTAMKPFNDAIAAENERERRARNFAFMDGKAARGEIADHDLAILKGRDLHGYHWNEAVTYAWGWYGAHSGSPYGPSLDARRTPEQLAAYDRGFADGGGNRDDLFDAARRGNLAALRSDNRRSDDAATIPARPLPSSWPQPGDHARPTRWSRRLIILADSDAGTAGDVLAQILARPGAAEAAIVVLGPDAGFVSGDDYAWTLPDAAPRPLTRERAEALIADTAQGEALRRLIGPRDIDDVLVALQGEHLRVLDAFAAVLPLCRSMERTRHTALLQRGHLRIWLDRGHDGAGNIGAGHIRWGKAIHGLTGKLGEFTARYAGPVAASQGRSGTRRGHLIRIEVAGGLPAMGYATSSGLPLDPEIVITNKAHLRREMAVALRAFAGATRLMHAAA